MKTNCMYTGVDNLEIIRDEVPNNSIDLIATDPPFNSGRNYIEFDDRFKNMNEYLHFMVPRLKQMYYVLKDTGSLYLHCDTTASHYLKIELDKIFGIKQFRNQIVWCYATASNPNIKQFPKKYDTILWYSKTDKYTFNKHNLRVPYKNLSIGGEWLKEGINKREHKEKKLKEGKLIEDWWTDISVAYVQKSTYSGYPTEKPIELYKRIIGASSNEKEIVLDPFCGSGTTLIAAKQLNRKFIGIDKNPKSSDLFRKRLRHIPIQLKMEL